MINAIEALGDAALDNAHLAEVAGRSTVDERHIAADTEAIYVATSS